MPGDLRLDIEMGQILRRCTLALRLCDAIDLRLLLLQPVTRFGQVLRSRGHAAGRFHGQEQAAAVGLVERHLLAVHARHLPAARMQEANAKLRIFVKKQRIVGIRLRTHAAQRLIAQLWNAVVSLPRQHKAALDGAKCLAVLVKERTDASQR